MASDPQSSSYWHFLSVFGTAVASVLGTLYFVKRGSNTDSSSTNVFVSLLTDTVGYLPHIMLLFGVIADAVSQEGVYSIASLIGVFSIVVNWILTFFWRAVGDIMESLQILIAERGQVSSTAGLNPPPRVRPRAVGRDGTTAISYRSALQRGGGNPGDFSGNYDGCDVQGFSFFHSKYAPQTLVVTATIFSYYLFDIISNRGWGHAISGFTLFAFLYIAQIFTIGQCGEEELGPLAKAAVAAIEGIFVGGTSYAVVQAYYPHRLPSSSLPIFPRKTADDLKPGPNGGMVDSSGNPYVCLPNGQCVPDLSTAEARKSFADMIAENLGTGSPAVPADCPANAPRT